MKPCGHAAHVDGVDRQAAHPAHNRLDKSSTCPHAHRVGGEYFQIQGGKNCVKFALQEGYELN